jgi:hypothetical protein
VVFASGQNKLIDQFSELHECLQLDLRLVSHNNHRASRLIKHPSGNNDPQFRIVGRIGVLDSHQDRRDSTSVGSSNDRHLSIDKRVKTINDPR